MSSPDANRVSQKISTLTSSKIAAQQKDVRSNCHSAPATTQKSVPGGKTCEMGGPATEKATVPARGTIIPSMTPISDGEDDDGDDGDGEWQLLDQSVPSKSKKVKPVPTCIVSSNEYYQGTREELVAELEKEIFPMKSVTELEKIVDVYPVFAKRTQLLDEGENIQAAEHFHVGTNLLLDSAFIGFDHDDLQVPVADYRLYKYKLYGNLNNQVQLKAAFGKFDESGKMIIDTVILKPKAITKHGFGGVFKNAFIGWVQILKKEPLPKIRENENPDSPYWEHTKKPTPDWAAEAFARSIAEKGAEFFYGPESEDTENVPNDTAKATTSSSEDLAESSSEDDPPSVETKVIPWTEAVEITPVQAPVEETPKKGHPPLAPARKRAPVVGSSSKAQPPTPDDRVLGTTHTGLAYRAMEMSNQPSNANRKLDFEFDEEVFTKKGTNNYVTSFKFSNSAIYCPFPRSNRKPEQNLEESLMWAHKVKPVNQAAKRRRRRR